MGTQPISLLKQMGFNIDNQRTLLEGLREKRIDIRTNLTNKRIDAGKFRVCYPFTLPIDKKSFITIAK
jgi:hypothetical protein